MGQKPSLGVKEATSAVPTGLEMLTSAHSESIFSRGHISYAKESSQSFDRVFYPNRPASYSLSQGLTLEFATDGSGV